MLLHVTKHTLIVGVSEFVVTEFPLTLILYIEQTIALRSLRHDDTPLDTGDNHGDVVRETHLATQNNNVL